MSSEPPKETEQFIQEVHELSRRGQQQQQRSPDLETLVLQHLAAQSALLQQISASLIGLSQVLDKLQPMPHVKIGTDSKGLVKPEVNVYHPDAAQAASTCEDIFDALDDKYNPSLERRPKAIPIPFVRAVDVDRLASTDPLE